MFPRGIKSIIAIEIGMLLLVSMVLIDVIAISISKKDFIRSEIKKGTLIISAMEGYIVDRTQGMPFHEDPALTKFLSLMMKNGDFECVLVSNREGGVRLFCENGCSLREEMENYAKQAIRSKIPAASLKGETWGLFWRQKPYLILSAPIGSEGGVPVGGASILFPLDRVYAALRRSQILLSIYILINTPILAWVGFYFISKATVRPIQRLAKKADEYKEDGEIIFSARKEDSELHRLSKALNRMLKRIEEDREKLRATVRSLEQSNADLRQAQQDILKAEKLASVGRLASGIAHEIGNPIGIVSGYLDLLREADISPADRQEYIQRSQDELDRIRTIIRQLLGFSRPSNTNSIPVSVHDIIEDISQIARVQPLMSDMQITTRLEAEKDLVTADPDQLRQVFINLLINAADAIAMSGNRLDGKLRIQSRTLFQSGRQPENQPVLLELTFNDNGHGIPAEHMENIFDPFFSTKDPGKGTGLGLSVCYMIIESIGGSITVASEEGFGTTVTIYLPLLDENP